jgi:hypothetical protein
MHHRTHGRTQQRPAPAIATQCDVTSRAKGMSSYQGWVRSALTQPRPAIVGTGRDLSREPALP